MTPAGRILALPLLLLALLFQVAAPVSAARAAAAMADPFAQVVICSPDRDGSDSKTGGQLPGRHDGQLCGACALCGMVGVAPPEPPTTVAAPGARTVGARLRPISEGAPRGPPDRSLPPPTGPPRTI